MAAASALSWATRGCGGLSTGDAITEVPSRKKSKARKKNMADERRPARRCRKLGPGFNMRTRCQRMCFAREARSRCRNYFYEPNSADFGEKPDRTALYPGRGRDRDHFLPSKGRRRRCGRSNWNRKGDNIHWSENSLGQPSLMALIEGTQLQARDITHQSHVTRPGLHFTAS